MTKPDLILLHGALGAHDQFTPLIQALQGDFTLHTFSFSGHGTRDLEDKPFRMATFVADLQQFISENDLKSANIFGYSMGGYAATELALLKPGLIAAIMTLGTKFEWSPEIAAREVRGLDPVKIKEKIPAFAETLAARHAAMGWETVMLATAEMMHDLGAGQPDLVPARPASSGPDSGVPDSGSATQPSDNRMTAERVASLTARMRFARGDKDRMVSLQETVNIFEAVPKAQLEILPATPHPLEQVDIQRLVFSIREFFITS